ncbi:HNH endonuclease [Chitinophaga niabensis]|uniref:HNH endonuclease n=1 Tax=Chitinophaga niabensis TaxID=536979 RepID=A0A1N6EPJ1_9BACT|nr:HNH endonuclease [Chitinophaga niabensis]SIN85009.1 HNH endonuclease [Chitinophaga niabensis]
MNCYNCGVILNRKNRSVEHIINASIGGFRKGYNLLCAPCNKAFGRTIDFDLGRQLGVFGRLLNIPLDRGAHSLSSEIGVIDCDRAIAKIGLNYYLSKGYAKAYIGPVRDFVRGGAEPVSYYYLPASDIHEEDEVSHIIHLHGGGGVLYAYIELFNMLNRVIIFSMDYAGEDIHVTYCRDVVHNRELAKGVDFRLGRKELEGLRVASDLRGEGLRVASDMRDEGLRVMEASPVRYERLIRLIERRRGSTGA